MEKLTFQSTIAQVLKNPKAVRLAERIHPGISTHPLLWMVKRKTIEQLTIRFRAYVTREQIQALLDQVNSPQDLT